jgi:DNA-binding response OmpR family regulator
MPDTVKKTKVLFVDDDADILSVVREYFGMDDDIEVETSSSADEGFAMARRWKPDIIFLDIMMPGKTGLQLLREFKEDEESKYIPIVMLTGDTTEGSKYRALRCFSEDYLQKPCTFFEIKKTILRVLDKKRRFSAA